MNNRGMTLIELIVVVCIVAILVAALGFQYSGWQGKYKVESQVKQLYSDLVGARTMAMQNGFDYFADFPSSNQYRISQDDSNGASKVTGGDGKFEPQVGATLANGTDNALSAYPKTVSYPLNWNNGAVSNNAILSFDKKGLIRYWDTTQATPTWTAPNPPNMVTISFTSTVNPDYDCIIASETMLNLGQMVCATATACNSDSDCSSGEACLQNNAGQMVCSTSTACNTTAGCSSGETCSVCQEK